MVFRCNDIGRVSDCIKVFHNGFGLEGSAKGNYIGRDGNLKLEIVVKTTVGCNDGVCAVHCRRTICVVDSGMALEIGNRAPIELLQDGGAGTSLGGKAAVLFFFKTSCPTCALAFPYLDRLDRAFPGEALRVAAVSQEPRALADEFARRCGVSVAIIDDSGLEASRAFCIENVPTFVLVDAAGKVQDQFVGHDKQALNRFAASVADRSASPAPVIAPDDDGAPMMQPG